MLVARPGALATLPPPSMFQTSRTGEGGGVVTQRGMMPAGKNNSCPSLREGASRGALEVQKTAVRQAGKEGCCRGRSPRVRSGGGEGRQG